jgi:tetratricopeptide (TPR) repeat protein
MEAAVRDRQILPIGKRPQPAPPPLETQRRRDSLLEAQQHTELGQLCLEQGQYEAALGQFEGALALHPHTVEGWRGRADALACLGRYEEALQSVEQANELAGLRDEALWAQKAALLILLNRPAAALNCCNHALWISPNDSQTWFFRGVALHQLGRYQQAYRSYQRAAQPAIASYANAIRRLRRDLALDCRTN